MPFSSARSRAFPLLALALACLLSGCADENLLGPAQGVGADRLSDALRLRAASAQLAGGCELWADLEHIWPNDDGRSWTYQIDERSWGDFLNVRLYPTAADVPPAPGLGRVSGLLHYHPIGANPELASAGYRMQFQGMKTTQSGAVGQDLETAVLDAAAPTSAGAVLTAAAATPAGFLAALAKARPDLAARIAQRWPGAARASAATSVRPPTFLFGYAWVKTPEYIGSYGDVDTALAWKYLEADLNPGSSFTLQLVPSLANDVFLRARVLRRLTVTTDAGTFRNALEVLYLVDFGVGIVTDADGNVLGYSRVYSYGTIDYVPGVGPVASYERGYVQPGRPLDPGQYDQTIRLTATASATASN